ncbi:MAG: response regulator, partial [Bacteroidota bacterium]
MSKITIALADSQYLIRVGLKHLIEELEQFEVTSEAANEKSLLENLERTKPHVVIFDYHQPDSFSIDTIEKIKAVSPTSNILVISGDGEKENV